MVQLNHLTLFISVVDFSGSGYSTMEVDNCWFSGSSKQRRQKITVDETRIIIIKLNPSVDWLMNLGPIDFRRVANPGPTETSLVNMISYCGRAY